MTTDQPPHPFWTKAEENLASASSEYINGRYNACANRCFYACFQAAIVALSAAGIAASANNWGHGFVQAQFAGQLISRRKLYPASERDTLRVLLELRHKADYDTAPVTEREASRAVRRAESFVRAIATRGGSAR